MDTKLEILHCSRIFIFNHPFMCCKLPQKCHSKFNNLTSYMGLNSWMRRSLVKTHESSLASFVEAVH